MAKAKKPIVQVAEAPRSTATLALYRSCQKRRREADRQKLSAAVSLLVPKAKAKDAAAPVVKVEEAATAEAESDQT